MSKPRDHTTRRPRRYRDAVYGLVHESADSGELRITRCERVTRGVAYESAYLEVTREPVTCLLCLAAPTPTWPVF